ncbi:hypothetical protein N9O51_01935, partial [Saprospiraceae bacterium]|nr:hypothetical protein [Saprospiraceae bacterium]
MSLYNKIKNTFNPPPSLKGEDWLLPSDDLFDSIESSIQNDQKKKNRGIWVWLLSLLFISGALSYLLTSNNTKIGGIVLTNNGDTDYRTTSKSSVVRINDVNKWNSKNLFSKVGSDNKEIATSKIEYNVEKSTTDLTIPFISSTSDKTTSVSVLEKLFNLNFRTNRRDRDLENLAFTSVVGSKISDIEESLTIKTKRISNNFASIASIASINCSLFREKVPPFFHEFYHIPNKDLSQASEWSLKLSSGSSNWNFSLNNNYRTTLDPADFRFSKGDGYFIELSIEKMLSQRLSVGVSGLIESSSFNSGHNSIIDYNINNETEHQMNQFDVIMASPLGFLESNIVVARSTDANEHTDLIIDLNNSHSITNIDFGFYAQIEILQYRNFSLSNQSGIGFNYLSNITNSLDHFSTSETGFISHSSEILKNQSHINLLRSYINIGINLEYKFS